MSTTTITGLSVRDNRSFHSLINFKPEYHDYSIRVPRDTFALLLQPEYNPDCYLSIRTDHDAGRYLFPEIDPSMGDYHAGDEIPYYDYYKGYVARLDKRPLSLVRDLDQTITITASGALIPAETYRIHVHRDAGEKIQSLFETKLYHDDEFDIDMPYELYVPTNYDDTKAYPILVCFHGTGERTEDPRTLVQTFAMATAFAEDSEAGHNPCIILAPQCVLKYDEDDNWTTVNQFQHHRTESPFYPMPQLKIAWKVLEKICSLYHVDPARKYLTGISSGAFGVYELAMMHPHTFAALMPLAGAGNPEGLSLIADTPVHIVHAEDDPVMAPSWSLYPLLKVMDQMHFPYTLTLYPKGQIFWQSGHFVWEVCYHDPKIRDWLFAQKRILC